MSGLRHLPPMHRRLLLVLFGCAMLVRALVPAGWMPTFTGTPGLILCDGMARPMTIAGMHHGHDAPDKTAPEHPCSFAGPVAAIAMPFLAAPLPPRMEARSPHLVRAVVAIGHGLAAPPPPQTGPPAYA